MKLFIQPEDLQARYAASPEWLQRLMTAWADALNFYLATHREVRPRVIRRFEPWMALSFTEGIGGDIERISLPALEAFYSARREPAPWRHGPREREPTGSERHRHRTGGQRLRARAAADQPAHELLLPPSCR